MRACHDDVSQESEDWVACSSCLARHHTACWQEGASCSSCGEAQVLAKPALAAGSSRGRVWLARLALLLGGAFLAVALLVGGLIWQAGQLSGSGVVSNSEAFRALHERKAQVVELRFFGGLTFEESAHVLGVSPKTIEADWYFARAWLRREMRAESSKNPDVAQ